MTLIGKIAYNLLPERVFASLMVLKNPNQYISIDEITYNQDRLITSHNCDFIRDDRFAAAYRKGEATGSWGEAKIHWRAFVACWAADRASKIDGDFVECGVNRGGLSRTVMEYIGFAQMNDRKFYLLDTFEGLAEEYISDDEKKLGRMAGGYDECFDAVKKTFEEFENAIIIKGAVPDTLSRVDSEKICYLSIDMNCMEPEIAAANFFWDKIASGGAMLLDDYGWSEHILQKHAFDTFAKERAVPILSLPTGQGLILKP